MSGSQPQFKVVIVDSSKPRFQSLLELMSAQNLNVQFLPAAKEDEVQAIADLTPDIVLINLFVEGKSTLSAIRALKAKCETVKVIVLTAHNSINNIRETVKAGADDFVVEPLDPNIMMDRIRYQLQEKELFNPENLEESETSSSESDINPAFENLQSSFQLVYDCLRILSEVPQHHKALTKVLKDVGRSAHSPRVNLIEGELETSKGLVAASSDDDNLQDLDISLEKYPEVREVLLNSSIIYIRDITQNPLTADIQENVKSIKIASMLVIPIRHRSHTLGALSIRLSGEEGSREFSERQLKTYFMVALALGPKLAARKLLRKHKNASSTEPANEATPTTPAETVETPQAEAPPAEAAPLEAVAEETTPKEVTETAAPEPEQPEETAAEGESPSADELLAGLMAEQNDGEAESTEVADPTKTEPSE